MFSCLNYISINQCVRDWQTSSVRYCKCIGKYGNDCTAGQEQVFVVWKKSAASNINEIESMVTFFFNLLNIFLKDC